MHQMPIEVLDSNSDDRLVEIKQLLTLHDPEDFVTVTITKEQIPQLVKALQSRLNKKEKKSTAAPAETKFESHFWSQYPACKRKVDRIGCERKWIANNLDEHAEAIAEALRRSAADPDWTKDSGAFIPQPKTWLNQRRWEAGNDGIAPDSTWNRVI